jgi:hypothetical protein
VAPEAGPSRPSGSEALHLAALSFEIDRVTAETTRALSAASVPSVLLKGPAIAGWLYPRERPRFYVDSDLLVRSEDWQRAISVLEANGFEDDLGPLAHPRMESAAGHPWRRAVDEAAVDLHCTLFGVGAGSQAVWSAFAEGAVRESIGGAEVSLPPFRARLLHIALHAVQHGGEPTRQPMIDLELAIARAPRETWVEALRLAARLDAAEPFAAGLRLLPEGRKLADAIGADSGRSTAATLKVEGVPLAEGFEELAAAEPGEAISIVARELFPNPAFMRWWTPLARRGRLGLAAAYAWRPLWLGYRAIPGYLAWRRARRPQ